MTVALTDTQKNKNTRTLLRLFKKYRAINTSQSTFKAIDASSRDNTVGQTVPDIYNSFRKHISITDRN